MGDRYHQPRKYNALPADQVTPEMEKEQLINNKPFGPEYQRQIFNVMLRDDHFCGICCEYLKASFFDGTYISNLFYRTQKFYERYKCRPDVVALDAQIQQYDKKDWPGYYQTLQAIAKAKPASDDYIKEALVSFVKRNKFIELHNTATDTFLADAEEAYRLTYTEINKIYNLSLDPVKRLDFDKMWEMVEEDYGPKGNCAPTGIEIFDEALGGGVHQGELCVFLGDSGVGKSIFLINQGCEVLKKGGKVLHVNLEGRGLIPMLRYTSNLSGALYKDVKSANPDIAKNNKNITDAVKLCKTNLQIFHYAEFDMNIERLFDEIRKIRKDFKFTTLIIDYGDLLKTIEKMEFRHQQTVVFRQLANMAAEFKVPVFTATQATRPEKNNDTNTDTFYLSQREVSENYEKVRVASVIISINRTDREVVENKVRLMLCKNRDGEKSLKVGCYSNYPRMKPFSNEDGYFHINGQYAKDALPPVLGETTYVPPVTEKPKVLMPSQLAALEAAKQNNSPKIETAQIQSVNLNSNQNSNQVNNQVNNQVIQQEVKPVVNQSIGQIVNNQNNFQEKTTENEKQINPEIKEQIANNLESFTNQTLKNPSPLGFDQVNNQVNNQVNDQISNQISNEINKNLTNHHPIVSEINKPESEPLKQNEQSIEKKKPEQQEFNFNQMSESVRKEPEKELTKSQEVKQEEGPPKKKSALDLHIESVANSKSYKISRSEFLDDDEKPDEQGITDDSPDDFPDYDDEGDHEIFTYTNESLPFNDDEINLNDPEEIKLLYNTPAKLFNEFLQNYKFLNSR